LLLLLLLVLYAAAAAAAAGHAGPWKSLWISCGVDPRENSDTRRYQNIFFRQPAEW
jgi:hypothetical protein